MSLFQSPFQLIIHPVSPDSFTGVETLTKTLESVEFIGSAETQNRYLVGEQFLSHLTFLGCSPDIELYPQDDKPYCYIQITETEKAPVFCAGINIKLPRCKACKNELSRLPSILQQGIASEITCHHCNEPIDPFSLNWRKSACIARNKIIIGNIYESEAVPDERLLTALQKETGYNWKYCYIRTS